MKVTSREIFGAFLIQLTLVNFLAGQTNDILIGESITIRGFLEGLEFIFEDFNAESLPELDEIFLVEAHYQELSKRFGYNIEVPEYFYQKFTKEQIGERDLDYALYILNRYQEKYPESPEMILIYADTYLLTGDFIKAEVYYKKLVDLGYEDEIIQNVLKNLE